MIRRETSSKLAANQIDLKSFQDQGSMNDSISIKKKLSADKMPATDNILDDDDGMSPGVQSEFIKK